jgi:hypothetical protein
MSSSVTRASTQEIDMKASPTYVPVTVSTDPTRLNVTETNESVGKEGGVERSSAAITLCNPNNSHNERQQTETGDINI